MAQSWFSWKGIDCRAMGVIMQGPAPIIRPEERVQHVTIPGRSGDLTQVEGEQVYNSYIQTVSLAVKSGARVREIYKWLRGSGYVTFSGEPDRRQQARVIGAITLNRHSRNLDWWEGECQFYCQPLKELMQEAKQTVTTSGSTVVNMGDVDAKPMLKIVPSSTSCTVAANGHTPALAVTGLTGGTAIWVDCDTMEVWNAAKTALLTKNSAGDFPVLQPGANTLAWTNVTSIEIEKRQRFL